MLGVQESGHCRLRLLLVTQWSSQGECGNLVGFSVSEGFPAARQCVSPGAYDIAFLAPKPPFCAPHTLKILDP